MKNQKSQLKTKKTVEKTLQSICVYKGKRNGFTLIEVIISLAIFSILSIAIFNFINVSVKTNQKSEITQQATLLGQSLLEELGSLNQLKIGNNELFGLSNVTIEEENCSNNQYCINDLNINDFNVDVSMNLLKKNSDQPVQLFSNESQDIGLSIEIYNDRVKGQINNEFTGTLPLEADKKILEISIDKNNAVSLSQLSKEPGQSVEYANSLLLAGILSNGNTKINVQNNNDNGNQDAITLIVINNNSDIFFKGCLINKHNDPHKKIEIKFNSENKGSFEEVTKNESCKFEPSDNNGETDSPNNDGVNNSFQGTATLGLYEIQINIYHNNSNELVFSGDRVLPLDFIREEEAK